MTEAKKRTRKTPEELTILEKATRVKKLLDRVCLDNNEALKVLSIVKDSTTPITPIQQNTGYQVNNVA
ncbi:hypothetical protein FEK30_01110 (plasmid) [Picosynechococcus sp. PCC 11901]|uniref:hypothetical protein n=1 Tax=Picosynechococcus sp. PCC 11901 TaxID=2579791 RepID=UPI0010FBDDB6|nr:hypothetical protein [Picosynechococcus sp. PCC 11901]QCS48143.1 hypothetical protein FEK30_01110 [Picosynechococcus sp. PCC 11901]